MNDIVMPKLSDTMTEGRVISWKKQVGDAVRRGEVLAEVETDKANMELEAFAAGTLLEIRVPAGEMAQVGTVIAVIGTSEEKRTAATGAPPQPPGGADQAPQQAPQQGTAGAAGGAQAAPPSGVGAAGPSAGTQGGAQSAPAVGGPGPAAKEAEGGAQAPSAAVELTSDRAPAAAETKAAGKAPTEPRESLQLEVPAEASVLPGAAGKGAGEPGGGGVPQAGAAPAAAGAPVERAAPVVRRRARELGIDLAQVKGSGPEGRILLQDLERQQPAASPGSQPKGERVPEARGEAPTAGAGDRRAPLSRLRGAVARTVSESWRTIPHFSVTTDILMDEAESVRRQLKSSELPVTVNDLVVKAVVLALGKFPRLNASFADDAVTLHGRVNMAVAVGVPDGVLMPVIPDCQRLSLLEIAARSRQLVERARKGGLSEQDLTGGTFSVSNLGMYGVSQFSAVIYPSQAAVLAVGQVAAAVVPRSGVPACVKLMKVTLSADHRVVDGAYVAQFLAELKLILENPVRLLV